MKTNARLVLNPFLGTGLEPAVDLSEGGICTDPAGALELFRRCPAAHETPMLNMPALAAQLGLRNIYLKDERGRMGLGSFKALGAAFAIAKLAAQNVADEPVPRYDKALAGTTYVCASAGNHGLSMAAGARLFGARAVVFLSDAVPEGFAERLREKGAEVVRQGQTYEASMAAAVLAAERNGWQLLSDSSWLGYTEPARDVMEGYLIMGAEMAEQIDHPPSHIFLQAGVGGLAAACTAAARTYWGRTPKICVVEPDRAPALLDSIVAGKAAVSKGPNSIMGRLDCKEPSHLALKYLATEADAFMTVSDDEAAAAVETLARHGIATSPSGAAGLAGLEGAIGAAAGLDVDARATVLICISEGPENE
jgi:diaminopropionate ammonia-lyase